MTLTFDVLGTPVPQGSTRAFVRAGRAVTTSDNVKTKPWRQDIAWRARQVMDGELVS